MAKGIRKLQEFLSEANGQFSSIRLVLLAWGLGVLGVWTYLSIRNKTIQPVDNGIVAIFGILFAGKVVQKAAEEKPRAAELKAEPPDEPAEENA